MLRNTDTFYLNKEEPIKGCLLALRSIILKQDENVTETVKYGMPCFCYNQKMFCYLWVDKKTKEPYLLLVEGQYLHHPQLEKGDRARMKVFRVDPNQDLPLDTIQSILDDAIKLYKSGQIKTK